MVPVDHHLAHALATQPRQQMPQHRDQHERQQRLGQPVGERLQAGSEARRQNHRLHGAGAARHAGLLMPDGPPSILACIVVSPAALNRYWLASPVWQALWRTSWTLVWCTIPII